MARDSVIREEQEAWLRLTLVPGIGVREQFALLDAFGTAKRAVTATRAEVAAVVGDEHAALLARGPVAKALAGAMAWLDLPGNHLLGWRDPRYPRLLVETPAPPIVLYVRGRIELLDKPAVAIVGSRNATAQGVRDAEDLALALSNAGLAIVSGLALGIDAAAHRGGLRGGGSSIAVVGTGADRAYPRRNQAVADRLAAEGAVVSEFPLGTPPLPENFPRRNRIISGLALGVLVVEAAPGSGSLITARRAVEQNREVFAIPGSIHSPLARGCHQLIRQGAKLVETAQDVLEELRWSPGLGLPGPAQGEETAAADQMLDAMGHAPVSVDQLAERTGRSAAAIAARLALLEMRGAVSAIAGGFFQRMSARTSAAKRVIE